jgi:hypothetical protein
MRDALREKVEPPVSDPSEQAVWTWHEMRHPTTVTVPCSSTSRPSMGASPRGGRRMYTVEKGALGRWEAMVRAALEHGEAGAQDGELGG